MNKNKQPATKMKLDELTTNTELMKLSPAQQIDLFEQLNAYIKTSNMKNDYKPLIGLMVDTIKSLSVKNRKLQDQIRAATSNPVNSAANQSSIYSSYSKCVQNKPTEHSVIIKVADSVGNKDSIDLKKTVFEQLKSVKSKIDVIKINRTRDSLIFKARNIDQQTLMIEKLKNQPSIQADKPKERIPSILISEIEREHDLDSKEKIEKFIMSELAANEGIKEENAKIKITMCNPKFYTIKFYIINFDAPTTKAILNKGHVKIGYKICPVAKMVKVIQCGRCQRFGHFEKNKDSSLACRSKEPSCNFCAGNHSEDQCSKDKTKPENRKCLNCGKCHTAIFRNCEARVAREKEQLSRCSC